MILIPCDCCAVERKYQGHHTFSLGCLYCGARAIKQMANYNRPKEEIKQRRTKALKDWVERGHDEREIRALVASKYVPIEPLPKAKK